MAFGLTPWDPFRDFDRLERAMRRGFEWPFGRGSETIGAPAVEVTDEGDHYQVRAEIPGVPEDEVDINLSGNVLTIRGEKRFERKVPSTEGGGQKAEEQEEGETAMARREGGGEMARPLFSEVYYGKFERMLTLPDDIDPEKIEATSKHGVFTIDIGKKAAQRARKITVSRH